MIVQKISSGESKPAYIETASDGDFRRLTEHRFYFDWMVYKHTSGAYVLRLMEDRSILGVMTLEYVPGEERIEIVLLSASRENVGKKKLYDRITGCLLAFACYKSYLEYGIEAMVSLLPKTVLREHYMKKYGMKIEGIQLALKNLTLTNIIHKYLFKHEQTKEKATEAG